MLLTAQSRMRNLEPVHWAPSPTLRLASWVTLGKRTHFPGPQCFLSKGASLANTEVPSRHNVLNIPLHHHE